MVLPGDRRARGGPWGREGGWVPLFGGGVWGPSGLMGTAPQDSKRFGRNIRQAMLDIAELFDKPAEKAGK